MHAGAEQVKSFRKDGWCAVPGFFSMREVAAMRAELARFRQLGWMRNVRTEGDGKTPSVATHNLQICPIAPRSRFHRALPFHPAVVEAVEALIGVPAVFYLDQIFLKPARTGTGTDWHQDNAYFGIPDPTKGTGMWIALDDATVANGTMHVVSGSHREAFAHDRDLHSDHHIHAMVDGTRAVPVELGAGGVLFFNFGVAHCTKDNRSEADRAGLALHFLHADWVPESRKTKPPPIPPLSGPACDGGRVAWGEDFRGQWDAEVARVLAGLPEPGPAVPLGSQQGG